MLLKVHGTNVSINLSHIVDEILERAVHIGYNRAHKYTETPTVEQIAEEIRTAFWNEIDPYISYDDANYES